MTDKPLPFVCSACAQDEKDCSACERPGQCTCSCGEPDDSDLRLDAESGGPDHERPSYRDSLRDAGRGHLLP